jgi:hypothetical protein
MEAFYFGSAKVAEELSPGNWYPYNIWLVVSNMFYA